MTEPVSRKMLGEILVERGLLTPVSVQRMVKLAESRKMLLGAFLENVGLITPEELADALALQFGCRKIFNFADYTFSPQLLRMISLETAVEHNVFPLKLDGGRLGLAVSDPGNSRVLAEVAAQHDVRVIPFVSTRL
ncbi:MAG TPA: histidine kinase, partial [Verrucomicrobiae bacterium]|nr:histidine kinase [Verrucomicrobiae bacterium]